MILRVITSAFGWVTNLFMPKTMKLPFLPAMPALAARSWSLMVAACVGIIALGYTAKINYHSNKKSLEGDFEKPLDCRERDFRREFDQNHHWDSAVGATPIVEEARLVTPDEVEKISNLTVRLNTPRELAHWRKQVPQARGRTQNFDLEKSYYTTVGRLDIGNLVTSPQVSQVKLYQPVFGEILNMAGAQVFENKSAVKTGPTLGGEGFGVVAYCVDHRSPVNLVAALCNRQLSRKTQPAPAVQAAMIKFLRNIWNPRQNNTFETADLPDFEEYMADHAHWPKSKKVRYRAAWEAFKNFGTEKETFDFNKPDNLLYLEASVKASEENSTVIRGSEGNFTAIPRNIGSLRKEYLFVHYLQSALLKQQSRTCPDFCYRKTIHDYESTLNSMAQGIEDPVYISTDVSRFDSVQFAWLMEEVDVVIWKAANEFFQRHFSWWTQEHSKLVLATATSTKVLMKYQYAGVRILDVILYGTTPSGLGPKTTDGNSRRCRAVNDFIDHLAGLPTGLFKAVTGDDFFRVLSRVDARNWEAVARTVYVTGNDEIEEGIAWECKKITVQAGASARFDFVSKTNVVAANLKLLTRDFCKTLTNSRFYYGRDRGILQDSGLHRRAVCESNLIFFQHEHYLGGHFSLPKEDVSRMSRNALDRYLERHSSIRGSSELAKHRVHVSMLLELSIFLRWKKGFSTSPEELHALLTQYRNKEPVIKIPSFELANALVGASAPAEEEVLAIASAPNEVQIYMDKVERKKNKRARRARKERIRNDIGQEARNQAKELKVNNPKAKRLSKGLKSLTNQAEWTKKHQLAEYKYALGLFNPSAKICLRIPSPLPLATAASTLEGHLTLQPSPSGYLFCYLDPFNTNVLRYISGALASESTALGATSGSVATIMTSTNATRYRPVSASLTMVDLSNSQVKTGTTLVGSFPLSQFSTGNLTGAALGDGEFVQQLANQAISGYKGGFYCPMDSTSATFYPPGTWPGGDWMAPFFFITSMAPSGSVSIKYCINYEYTPAPAQSDLLQVQKGEVGSVDNGLQVASEVRAVREQHKVQSDDFTLPQFIKDVGGDLLQFVAEAGLGMLLAL